MSLSPRPEMVERLAITILEEALTWIDDYVDAIRRGAPEQTLEPLEVIIDAARSHRRCLEDGKCTKCGLADGFHAYRWCRGGLI